MADGSVAASNTPPDVATGRIYASRGMVRIYDKPDRESTIIGAIRAGQGVARRDDNLSTEMRQLHRAFRCIDGWFGVQPRGFVCVGGEGHGGYYYGTLDANDPGVIAARAALPDVDSAYPFHFGVSLGTPQYLRIPTAAEQRRLEPDLDQHLANLPADDPAAGGAVDVTPAGRPAKPELLAYITHAQPELQHDEDAFAGMKIAWTEQFDANGRTWLLTPNMTLIPKDRVRQKPLPTLQGIDLKANPQVQLPLAFMWLDDAPIHKRAADDKLAPTGESVKRHQFVAATLHQDWGPGGIYWQMKDGGWLKYQNVSMIRKANHRPPGVGPNDKWVDVRVTWGYIVAYEGDEPVYVTAMSPGVDGINPRKHATARGRYHVGWKMISADMSGRDGGADWQVEEVPWVQYYKGSYALHGAWWHNDFGRPKSHGCVNLAPADARHLFQWMDPQIPEDWYAATSYYPHVKGTLVNLRP